ncbi:MAG: hypothetical protein DSZ24_04265 [Thermodesulfatator sp.]|nr:MAG: hypothetical protein DSZ24_04265 [Thermodesulfatator sp.]
MDQALPYLVHPFLSIAGFVLFFLVLFLNYKAIEDLKEAFGQVGERLEKIEEHLSNFKVEVAERYLRRDEWLAFHNKMEASLKTEIRELKEAVRALFKETN